MSKIGGRGGHSQASCGAIGLINELTEDRKLYPKVLQLLSAENTVVNLTPPESYAYPQELMYGINLANASSLDYAFSIHFNSSEETDAPIGSEVWIGDGASQETKNRANRIVNNLVALGFVNRGLKYSPREEKLGEILDTNMPWFIIEICFVSSKADVDLYNRLGVDAIAKAVAEGLLGHSLSGSQPIQATPVSQPVQPIQVDRVAEAKKFIGTRCTELQTKLNKIGYKLTVDGDFGNLTFLAVIDFQGKNGLVQDGLAGNATFSKLNEVVASLNVVKPTPQPTPVVHVVQDIRVQQFQHNLNRLFNSGLVEDNIAGGQTNKAMAFATSIFGVSGLDNLLTATNQVLSFPYDAVDAPHLEYATRYIAYRLGLPISGVYDGKVAQKVANWQSGAHIGSDGKFGNQSWTQLMK